AQVQYYRGLAQYYLGDRPEALRQWQKVIETDPSTIHPKAPTTLKSAYLIRGMAYYRLGEQKAAIQDCLAALKIDDADAGAWLWLGLARLALGNVAVAFKDFSTAIHYAPTAENFYYRAVVHWLQDDREGAIADLDRAVQQRPSMVNAYYLRSLLYATAQDSENAEADYQRALEWEAKPSLPVVWNEVYGCYARGCARQNAGHPADARTDLQFVDQQCRDTHNTVLTPRVVEALAR
ncbi:MAG: tetratricopeptide repeat protein, partial [Leptolyngbyaceae bacterium]|nr:tetratricopeptide repeat protein [Leptolyngbyaceae bacterium]